MWKGLPYIIFDLKKNLGFFSIFYPKKKTPMIQLITALKELTQSAEIVEYTDCTTAEG